MSRRRLGPLIGATLLLLATCLGAVAGAQEDTTQEGVDAPAVRLHVAALSSVLGPGSLPPTAEGAPATAEGRDDISARVLVENLGDEPVGSLTVTLEVFDRVRSRSALHVALDDGTPQRVTRFLSDVDAEVRDGGDLAPRTVAGVTLQRTATQLRWTNPTDRRGVYPVRFTVSQGRQVLDQAVSAVVFLGETFPGPFDPLQVTMVVPITDTPWRGPDGTYPPGIDAPIRAGGRLDSLLRAVERAGPNAAVTFAPAPHLMEDLEDRADGFPEVLQGGEIRPVAADDPEAVRAANFLERLEAVLSAAPGPPVAGTYADADLGALVAAEDSLDGEATAALVQARRRLAERLDRQPALGVYWSPATLDTASLDTLVDTGLDVVFVPWVRTDAVPLEQLASTPEPVRTLRTPSGRAVTALVTDPWLDEAFVDEDDVHGPLVAANRFLAETAMIWMETPAVRDRAVVVDLPSTWDPGAQTADALFSGAAAAGWLSLVGPEQIVRRVDDPARVNLQASDNLGLGPTLVTDLVAARTQLAALARSLVGDEDLIEGRPLTAYDEDLTRATSWWWRPRSDTRAQVLGRSVLTAVDRAFGDVNVPADTAITLTDVEGVIPVTLQRTSGEPIEVLVEVDGGARLEWPQGSSRTVELQSGAARTISFPTRARTTGRIALQVTVTDPEGGRVISQATLAVRSTAISGPALAITGATIVALFLAGVVRRRRPKPRLEVVRDRVG